MKTLSLFTIIAAFLCTSFLLAPEKGMVQDKKKWVVPEASKKAKNTVASNDESLALGKELYNKHCKSCHGVKGKGDGPKAAELDTPSGDFTEKAFQDQTDGEIFYKTKEGRDDMPTFKKKLPEDDDIWAVVNYIRKLK